MTRTDTDLSAVRWHAGALNNGLVFRLTYHLVTRLPRAASYLALGDFSFWRLEVEEARLIAGFGEIRWLDGAALRG